MLSFVKQGIKQVLHAAGIEARRFHPGNSPLARLMVALRHFNIDLVLDIGANEGQFGRELRGGGYSGTIVSFEPLSSAHARLLQASASDKAWHVQPRCAVGARVGEIELNISGNSVSSSILPMLSAHRDAAPHSSYQGRESTPLVTLDSVASSYLRGAQAPFLKIDTQGYEWQVLDGAREILPRIRGIQLELSLVPLYEGQRLWRDCVERLEAEGFVLWALQPEFVDPVTGRTLQWDGLFFRTRI
ncbi:MAG: FkbM family methyltransferase [Nitrospiraceae bacterium]|jgi:FkbM family methyltransferase|nr:FkbM family methyltransferase [Nitrospiraceae bacterium]